MLTVEIYCILLSDYKVSCDMICRTACLCNREIGFMSLPRTSRLTCNLMKEVQYERSSTSVNFSVQNLVLRLFLKELKKHQGKSDSVSQSVKRNAVPLVRIPIMQTAELRSANVICF